MAFFDFCSKMMPGKRVNTRGSPYTPPADCGINAGATNFAGFSHTLKMFQNDAGKMG